MSVYCSVYVTYTGTLYPLIFVISCSEYWMINWSCDVALWQMSQFTSAPFKRERTLKTFLTFNLLRGLIVFVIQPDYHFSRASLADPCPSTRHSFSSRVETEFWNTVIWRYVVKKKVWTINDTTVFFYETCDILVRGANRFSDRQFWP